MEGEKNLDGRTTLSDLLREGLESSKRSLTRMEEEGEKLVKRILELSEKYVPESQRKQLDELSVEAGDLFGQIHRAVEENARKMVERLNIPTKKDLEEYNRKVKSQVEEVVRIRFEKLKVSTVGEIDLMGKQLRRNLDDQIEKVLSRLKIATKADVEDLRREIKRFREKVASLQKAGSVKPKAPVKKKTKTTTKKRIA